MQFPTQSEQALVGTPLRGKNWRHNNMLLHLLSSLSGITTDFDQETGFCKPNILLVL